ncbi:RAG2 PHD domain containing protein [Methylobacterium sp. NEAU 140]|uniref:RAG2 PHD domain containing protein n=1 Tax=Methylobacterium sp. NEAU 140 TaxID=3064945 RepID=UPI00273774F4|nr:RAG2 PHD domain containing protein [Methylobacterium sp. NEAU 140]MDP4022665.1 RAG2 PHD domain containing protein [Methylobacterium sp. NEAU 140]
MPALNPTRPAAQPVPTPRAYLVGQDESGHWVAVEAQGLAGGIFRTRGDAIRYACGETGCRPGDVAVAPGPIVFRLS